jgi:hypothetical protein
MPSAWRPIVRLAAVLGYSLASVVVLGSLFVGLYGGDCFNDPQCIAHRRAFERALPLLVVAAMCLNNLLVLAIFGPRSRRA